MLLAACSEDDIVPNTLEENYFLEPITSSEFELALQKEFFEKEGVYLLFNDTLSREYLGDDVSGNPVYDYQIVDLSYSMIASAGAFAFQYLQADEEKQAAADFLSDNVLPSLGESMRPYSFLVVDVLEYYEDYYGELVLVDGTIVYSGWNCTAIAVQGINEMSEAEQESYRLQLLKSMANNKMQLLDESVFDEFYAFCESYYSTYFMYEEAEAFCQEYPTQYDLGFLSTYSYGYNGYMWLVNFKAKSYDLEDYTNAIFDTPEEEFRETYADYPIVLEKYQILKDIIESLGIIL